MRIGVFILSLLVVIFSLVPCGDEPSSYESISIEAKQHQRDSDHHDTCSPFCACHCCHSHFIVYQKYTIFLVKDFSLSIQKSVYNNHIEQGYTFQLLHPPQV
ncbi:DUF6660 family protein [Algivirga pacifica]|uniref:DUF6660 family protein n=1 Tax=Algivirga pacifica TaxID=1162670 RepID=UPI003CD087BE